MRGSKYAGTVRIDMRKIAIGLHIIKKRVDVEDAPIRVRIAPTSFSRLANISGAARNCRLGRQFRQWTQAVTDSSALFEMLPSAMSSPSASLSGSMFSIL
ncbi:hypothetical protein AWB69_05709 [Caballeronia udeis]|uniref:Uncharacterized protein n=1 Tax=Caballeronia udeis TaxID=1232866 RepID=A0A158IBK7_9BURK|nr:hypothetical protein AWB69_05709 [Caballeronia udeis]